MIPWLIGNVQVLVAMVTWLMRKGNIHCSKKLQKASWNKFIQASNQSNLKSYLKPRHSGASPVKYPVTSKLRSDISSETNTNIQAQVRTCKQSLTSKFTSDLSEARTDIQAQVQSSIKSVNSEASRQIQDQMSDIENSLDTTVQRLKDELSDLRHELEKQHDKHQVC